MRGSGKPSPAGAIEIRAVFGTIAGGVAILAGLIQSLIQVPVLLHFWSPEVYGAWMIVLAVTGLAGSFDLGHQNYLGNRFNRLWIENQEELRTEIASGVRFAVLIAIAELGVGIALFASGWIARIAASSGIAETGAIIGAVMLYLVFWTVNGSVGGVLVRLYPPAGLYARSQWLGICYRLLGFVALLAAAGSGAGLIGAMGAQVAVWGLFNIYLFAELRMRFPILGSVWLTGRWAVGWRNFRASLALTLNGVMEQVTGTGLVLIVARAFAPTQVAVLTTMRTVANVATQGTAVLLNPIVPDLVRFHVKGDGRKLNGAFAMSWMTGGTLIAVSFLVLLWFIEPLYGVWTRNTLPFNPTLFATLVAAVCVRQWVAPLQAYLHGINRLPPQTAAAAIRAAVTLATAGLLLPVCGVAAAGWGLLAGEALGSVVIARGARCELAGVGSEFPAHAAALAASQVVLVSIGLTVFGLGVEGGGIIFSGLAATALWVGWRQWLGLDAEIRARASVAVTGIWKRTHLLNER